MKSLMEELNLKITLKHHLAFLVLHKETLRLWLGHPEHQNVLSIVETLLSLSHLAEINWNHVLIILSIKTRVRLNPLF